MGVRLCLLALLAAGACVLPACGDDGGEDSASASNAQPHAEIDGECNAARPYHVESTGDTREFYRLCASEDQLSVEVQNTSPLVLSVRSTGSRTPKLLPGEPVVFTPKDAAINDAVQTECAGKGCRVSPNGFVIAEGAVPVGLEVDVAPAESGVAAGAALVGGYATSKLQTRAQRFTGVIKQCADSVGPLVKHDQTLEEVLRHAFKPALECPGAYSTIKREAGERPLRPAGAATRLLDTARPLEPILKTDLFQYEAVHVTSQFLSAIAKGPK
jgi:hypothetical protein